MARRMGPEAAYEMTQRTMEENPGASRAEMRAKAEQMVDSSRMPRMTVRDPAPMTPEMMPKRGQMEQVMTERQTPSAPAPMQYDAAASAKLAELRGQSAFDVGFRQGLEDYQKMKAESPNIIDELSGSTEEANRARSAIFMGNMTSSDIKRLGYAEAMEFAEREEKTGADKMLRQGMME